MGVGTKVPRGQSEGPFLPRVPLQAFPPNLCKVPPLPASLDSRRPSSPRLWASAQSRERAPNDLHFHVEPGSSPPAANRYAATRQAAATPAARVVHPVAGSARRGVRRDRRAARRDRRAARRDGTAIPACRAFCPRNLRLKLTQAGPSSCFRDLGDINVFKLSFQRENRVSRPLWH